MNFKRFGIEGNPVLVLLPGLGVSYEIFLPLIKLLEDRFSIVAVQVDGFTLGEDTKFTSVQDQAEQLSDFIKENFSSHISVAYGLSLGGKILSHYKTRLNHISGKEIYYWYGTKEAFVAKPQVKHLKALFPQVNVEVFTKLNHGQLLVDFPEEVAKRIVRISR